MFDKRCIHEMTTTRKLYGLKYIKPIKLKEH